jgi:phosphoglycerate kinase
MKKYDRVIGGRVDDGMKVKTPTLADIRGKRVLMRVDFNVPVEKKNGQLVVTDEARIKASLPTLDLLRSAGAQTILLAHFGRPDAHKSNSENAEYSLAPIAKHVAELTKRPVKLVASAEELQPLLNERDTDTIWMLENVRFDEREEKNSYTLAKEWAQVADVYINDAFSVSHRAHASVAAVTDALPSFAGLGLAAEVEHLSDLLEQPKRPFVMIVGGKKISDKVGAVVNLAKIADVVLLGGGTANNFLKAEGFDVHRSVVEEQNPSQGKRHINYVHVAEELIEDTKQEKMLLDGYIPIPKIVYPIDVVAANSLDSQKTQIVELVDDQTPLRHPEDLMYLDIGPKTIKLYKEIIQQASTIFWNGPMGVFEEDQFASGTKEIAEAVAKSPARTVLGGGDTLAAAVLFGLSDRYDYMSVAGGAALEFLAGNELPGVTPLLEK